MGDLILGSNPHEQFDILEKLGEGSYGSVYKALFKPSGETYALKFIPISESETVNQVLQEVKVMEGINSEYIVATYGNYIKDDKLFIVLEYCGIGSVADILKLTNRTLTESEIANIASDSLKGLAYMHQNKKIHRDIKAGNILITTKGQSKLADFGVTGQLSDHTIKRSTLTGTPYWMAPEVVLESGYDGKADVWSLGITCIEMAHGKPPYHSVKPMLAMIMIPNKPPPTLDESKNFSPEFKDFIAKCLAKNPGERPTSSELLEHPFLKKAKGITPLVEEVQMRIIERGPLQDDDDDDEIMDEANSGTVKAPRYSDDTSKMYPETVKKGSTRATDKTILPVPSTYDDTMKVSPNAKPLDPNKFNAIPLLVRDDDAPIISLYFEDQTSVVTPLDKPMFICRESSSAPPNPNSLCFKSKVISRCHCKFDIKEDRYYIQDVGSSSGTYLNQVRLSEAKSKSDIYYLKQGDQIRLGISLDENNQELPEDQQNVPDERRCLRIRVLMIIQNDEFPRGNLLLALGTTKGSMNTSGPKRRID